MLFCVAPLEGERAIASRGLIVPVKTHESILLRVSQIVCSVAKVRHDLAGTVDVPSTRPAPCFRIVTLILGLTSETHTLVLM